MDITYETILVSEIHPALYGTCFSTKGTHFIGSVEKVVVPLVLMRFVLILLTA